MHQAAATPPVATGDTTVTGSGPRLAGPGRSTLAGRPARARVGDEGPCCGSLPAVSFFFLSTVSLSV
jgi:hypothetical protein